MWTTKEREEGTTAPMTRRSVDSSVDSREKINGQSYLGFPKANLKMGVIMVSIYEILLKPNVRFSKMHPSGMSMRCPSFAITKNTRCVHSTK